MNAQDLSHTTGDGCEYGECEACNLHALTDMGATEDGEDGEADADDDANQATQVQEATGRDEGEMIGGENRNEYGRWHCHDSCHLIRIESNSRYCGQYQAA